MLNYLSLLQIIGFCIGLASADKTIDNKGTSAVLFYRHSFKVCSEMALSAFKKLSATIVKSILLKSLTVFKFWW